MEPDQFSFQTLLEETSYIPQSYSGRGMYGRTCLSVSLNKETTIGMFVGSILETLQYNIESYDYDMDIFNEVREAFLNMQTDQMGMGIVVYFPEIKYISCEEDSAEDSD